jgi:putative transposase
MLVNRSTKTSLKFSNKNKKDSLRIIMRLFRDLVNSYIDILWDIPEIHREKWISKEIQKSVPTRLSAVLQQKAGAEALRVIRSQINNKKRKKIKPYYNSKSLELDQRSVIFLEKESSFDQFIKFKNLGMNTIISCPIKFHAHYLKYSNWKRKNSVRIINRRGHFFLEMIFEKDIEKEETDKVIGIDVGIKKLMTDSDGNMYGAKIEPLIEKIQRKRLGSKNHKRALRERDEYINRTVKELPKDSVYVVEDLKGLKYKGKVKSRKKNNGIDPSSEKRFRSKLQYWNYRKVLTRIEKQSEVVGVQCLKVSPSYTSQRCPLCGHIDEFNRFGERFQCLKCQYRNDADIVGAMNILTRAELGQDADGILGDREVSSGT